MSAGEEAERSSTIDTVQPDVPTIVARVASRMYLFDVAHAKSFT